MDKTKLRKDGRTRMAVAYEIAGRLHGIGPDGHKIPPQEISLADAELIQNSDISLFGIPGGCLTPEQVVGLSKERAACGSCRIPKK